MPCLLSRPRDLTCCVPMSIPQAHLVAFCSDIGISRIQGAAMLSVLLGMAFLSRQLWGAISDRIGGLIHNARQDRRVRPSAWRCFWQPKTSLACLRSPQYLASVSAVLFPPTYWRRANCFPSARPTGGFPTLLLCSGSGMATGGWIAGVLYDYFGHYAPAFATGVAVSMINFMIISVLAFRRSQTVLV